MFCSPIIRNKSERFVSIFKIGLVVEFIETHFLWSIFFVNCRFHLVSKSLNQFCFGSSRFLIIWRFGKLCFLSVAKD